MLIAATGVVPRFGVDGFPKLGNIAGMKLADFMRGHGLSDDAFAARVGGCSAFAVRKWKYGERIPRGETLNRIAAATGGAVTANDFVPAPADAKEPAA